MAFMSGNKPIPLLFIFFYALLMWGGQYALRGFWEPDEARYVYVTKEMEHYGSPMIPMRNGEPYTHKPPLMFWLIRAATVFTGGEYNGFAGRFPSFLGAILALWVASRLALRWFDAPTGWRTVFILSTSVLFWKEAGCGQIDMLLLGLEMAALYLLFRNDEIPSFGLQAGAFSCMGLAILAKGPVGLIIPIGIYACFHLLAGEAGRLKKAYWVWGIPLALAFPAAWLLGAKIQGAGPQFFHELLFSQNIGRATGQFGWHDRPFYYFIKYLLIHFLPWIFFIPISISIMRKDDETLRRRLYPLLGWMLFVVVFFSAISSKRDIYILAVYPAAAIMVAAAWPEMALWPRRWVLFSVYPLLGILLALGVVALVFPAASRLPVPEWIFIPSGLAATLGAILLMRIFIHSGVKEPFFTALNSIFIAIGLTVGMIVFPGFDAIKTPVKLAEAARPFQNRSKPLLLYRMNGEILSLYSGMWGKEIGTPAQMRSEMKKTGRGIAVFDDSDWMEVKEDFGNLGKAEPFQVGSKKFFYLLFCTES